MTVFEVTDTNDPLREFSKDFFEDSERRIKADRKSQIYIPEKNASRYCVYRYPQPTVIPIKITNFRSLDAFSYFFDSFNTYTDEKDKTINNQPQIQQTLNDIKDMMMNYAALFAMNPDMWPDIEPRFDQEEGIGLTAARLFDVFSKRGYPQTFMIEFNKQLESTDQESFEKLYTLIFHKIRQRFANSNVNIFDSPDSLVQVLISIVSYSDNMKVLYMNQKGPSGAVWIPGPSGINLEKGIGSCTGDNLEHNSIMGPLFQPSFLPNFLHLNMTPNMDIVVTKVKNELGSAKSESQFEKVASNLCIKIHSYNKTLCEFIKTLMKAKQCRDNILRFLGACVVANTNRAKLGHSLVNNSMQNKLSMISSDAFALNACYVLYELCVPFLDLSKEPIKKLDPLYIPSGIRIDLSEETPININKETKQEVKFAKEFGTISEFYFLFFEMMHFALLHITRKCEEIRNMIDRMKEEKNQLQPGNPIAQKYDTQIENLKKFRYSYELSITDPGYVKMLEHLYSVHMELMKQWGEFDATSCSMGVDPVLFHYLPEGFLFDINEIIIASIKINRRYALAFSPDFQRQIIEFGTVLLNSGKCLSNPYIKAKMVDLISIIIYSDPKQRNIAHICNSDIMRDHFMAAIVRFYVEIEFAGSSEMFYAKFQYRHDCSSIFKILWPNEFFKGKVRELINTEIFEKFLNCLINDMTFCLEEGIAKLQSIKAYENKQQQGIKLTKEEIDGHSQNKKVCKANFQLAGECIWNSTELSDFAKQIYQNEAFAERTANTFNFVLKSLVGPENFEIQIQDPASVCFVPVELITSLAKIYSNLQDIECFQRAVVKDERSFNLEFLNKARRILKKNQVRTVDYNELDRFIKKIPEITQQSTELNEQILSSPPDDFLCPISCELMRDPVLLLTSGNICDRNTMKRILLNDEHDPFNRAPLKISELKDDVELKTRIEKWIAQKMTGQETDEDIRIKEQEAKQKDEQKDEKMNSPEKQSQPMVEEEDDGQFKSAFDDDDDVPMPNLSQHTTTGRFFQNNAHMPGGVGENNFDEEMDDELQEAIRMSLLHHK